MITPVSVLLMSKVPSSLCFSLRSSIYVGRKLKTLRESKQVEVIEIKMAANISFSSRVRGGNTSSIFLGSSSDFLLLIRGYLALDSPPSVLTSITRSSKLLIAEDLPLSCCIYKVNSITLAQI
jgi:hypothetical protein